VVRRWAPPLFFGVVLEFALAILAHQGWLDGTWAGLLLLPVAVGLGWAFGPARGMVASVVPLLVLAALDQLSANPAAGALAAVVFVALLLAFLAGMAGALRARYLR
jgi:hypothetical protein